jgi:hypothetical protein
VIAPWERRERTGSPPLAGGVSLNVDGKGSVKSR